MKAPDKIYCGNNGHGNLSYSSAPFDNATEYVRKDAIPQVEDTVAFQKGVEEGRRLERQEFQKVEGEWMDWWENPKGDCYAMAFHFSEEVELPAELYVKKK